MESFVCLGQISDDTLILFSAEIFASSSQPTRRFLPHHPWIHPSNARYDAHGSTNRRASNTRAVINDASSNQILQRRRQIPPRLRSEQIPPRLRSEHQGAGRATASYQNLPASLWRAETPNADSLSEEFISEKLKMDDGCSKSEEETCVICLDAIQMNHGEMSTTLRCGHVYHVGCIKTWVMVKNECALCRASVIPINGR